MARRHILEDSDEEDDDDVMIMEDDDHVGIADNDNNFPSNNAQQQQYQTSSSQHAQLQQHLVTQAGVKPSNYWLEQCINHIRGSNSTNVSGQVVGEGEACWTQILHADLRDVVRDDPTRDKSNDNNDNVGGDAAAVQLRNAILQSKINVNANNNNHDNANNRDNDGKYQSKSKVTLPSSFHLLIQMEEVVDVSMNCEQQLASMGGGGNNNIVSSVVVGTNNNNRGQQYHQQGGGNRNPKHRMLKMTFSDGYYSNGKAYPSSNASKENQILIANETSPIQNLHTTSPPGLKILLHGPIDIRLGQLQLNDGNCKVIGGEIQSWKEVWQRAKEKAQRTRGLGVDPTIKALCWNSDMGDELLDEVDEGEGESGDVAAAVAPPAPPPVAAMQQQQPPMQQGPPYQQSLNNNQPVITPPYQSTSQQTNSNTNVSGSQNRNQNQMPSTSNNTYSSATTSNNASRRAGDTGNNLRQRTLDSYPKKPRPETTRLLPSNNNAPSRPSVQSQITGNSNPYQQRSTNNNNNNNNSSQANSNHNNLAPMFQRQPHRQQPPAPPPPPMQNNSNVIPIDDSPPNHFQQKQQQQQPPSQRVQSNPYASLRPASSSAPSNNSSNSTSTPSNSFSSNPSFAELKALLQSLRKDRALYEQYYGKVITVPCKITTDENKEFNIVKAPPSTSPKKKGGGKTKKEKKKYEFLLVGKFLGPKASDGSIAMRVASSVLEPYFDMSAAEIRKLSREDKERANRIVNQCSSTFVHDFSSLQQFQMKLLLTADEFFAKLAQVPASSVDWMVDTGNPFLLVVKKG